MLEFWSFNKESIYLSIYLSTTISFSGLKKLRYRGVIYHGFTLTSLFLFVLARVILQRALVSKSRLDFHRQRSNKKPGKYKLNWAFLNKLDGCSWGVLRQVVNEKRESSRLTFGDQNTRECRRMLWERVGQQTSKRSKRKIGPFNFFKTSHGQTKIKKCYSVGPLSSRVPKGFRAPGLGLRAKKNAGLQGSKSKMSGLQCSISSALGLRAPLRSTTSWYIKFILQS